MGYGHVRTGIWAGRARPWLTSSLEPRDGRSAGDANGAERTSVMPSVNATRALVAAALAVFLLALGLAVALGVGRDGGTSAAPAVSVPTVTNVSPAAPKPKPPPLVRLTAVGAYDPEGDGQERDQDAPLAVDGRRDTAWQTEHYSTFFKSGVGLVLDMGRRRRVVRVTVDSPSPGASAEIRLGDAAAGPFALVSAAKPLTRRTNFVVARRAGRFLVVWIVAMPPDSSVAVAEVQVRAQR